MNAETQAVADFLSTEGSYTPIFTIVQEAQSNEQAAQQIEDYVIQQRRGPEELYESFAKDHKNFEDIDWMEIVKTFKTD